MSYADLKRLRELAMAHQRLRAAIMSGRSYRAQGGDVSDDVRAGPGRTYDSRGGPMTIIEQARELLARQLAALPPQAGDSA